MVNNWTPEQERAVLDRGGPLLVSAAAGSGKTKVLVDRLMTYLLDPDDPADIDDFLIITFTKAAAAELRSKIAAKLSEHIAERPDDRHLQRQLQRLYMTNISTVHAFCGEILRQYAYRLDLSADVRTADENECRQLRMEVITKVLEEAYEHTGEDTDFCALVDTQGIGRNDKKLPELLLKVYDSALCHKDPEQWLDACLETVDVAPGIDAAQTRWGKYLMEQLYHELDLQTQALERCADLAQLQDASQSAVSVLRSDADVLRQLRRCTTWEEVDSRKKLKQGTQKYDKRITDPILQEQIKIVRDAGKDRLKAFMENFADASDKTVDNLIGSAPAVRGMVKLVRQFSKAFSDLKRRLRILDFNDLEHRTLDLLMGTSRSAPTALALEIGNRFREVMVDEYQDSNQVQEAIYSALTAPRGNCFMVGDVKQSIYQFRMADPGIFLQKYADFVPAKDAHPGQGRKVMLSKNFRSGAAVLSAVNCVFETCMNKEVGDLDYGPDEALYDGKPHIPLGEPEVELYAINVQGESYKEEAAFTVKRISELLDGTHMIRGEDGLRPIRPEDIVILLRAPKSMGIYYRQALEEAGIRCVSGDAGDLLKMPHINALRSLLQIIQNPQQDIPLVAALASPLFGFTADELASIRSQKRVGSIYDALCRSELPKAKRFLEVLVQLRRQARASSLAQLMETIFTATKIDSIYGTMADGAQKRTELMAFYQMAVNGTTGQTDLARFLDHLEAMEEQGLKLVGQAGGPGYVTIMSTHRSKGLEFPVVFLCGLARHTSHKDEYKQVLCHKELGIGVSGADAQRRVSFPTVAKQAIAQRMSAQTISEELRILYVAMTRAKDRLIMTYTAKNLTNELTKIVARMNLGQQDVLSREAVCPGEWVLMSALKRTEAGAFFALGGNMNETKLHDHIWKIQVVDPPAPISGTLEEQKERMPAGSAQQLKQDLSYRYAHPAATVAPSKQTATQRKGRDKDQEAAENAGEPTPVHRYWRKASFADTAVQGRERGVALHKAMQYIRYEACTDEDGVRSEIRRLVSDRFLSEKQGSLVDCGKIAGFFATDIGKRLRSGENVLREFKFSILDHGEEYDPELHGEQILLQGVVDCALMEEDGICVIDFKTDRVTAKPIDKVAEGYRPQVEAYVQALGRIFERPVKRSCLYFFHMEQFVEY